MASVDLQAIRTAAAPLLAYLPASAWLPHALVRKPDGNLDKPPCMGARTNAPETWFTLEAALGHLTGRNEVAGIGFAIVRGLIAYDFDHCRDEITGELADEVQVELETLNSYAYVTPSKTGIRVVGTNSAAWAILPGKFTRWLPGGHKIEIFVGPVNFYNTFTADIIEGYDTLRDISTETTDHIQGLDDGRKGSNGSAVHLSNPDPQRSIAAIRAALAIIPNEVEDWDEWCRIGMAVWRSSGGSGAGLDAWHDWSSKHACYDAARCDERWQHWFISPPTKIGFGTLHHEARKIRPLFVPPFDGHTRSEAPDSHPQADAPPKEKKQTRLLTMRELDALPPPVWLINGLVPEKSLVVPFGPPKSGKTFIVLSFCLHIAAGKTWFGYAVTPGAVVYIAGEGTGGLSLRLRAMRSKYDISIDAPLWVLERAVNFQLENEVDELISLVRRTVGQIPVRVVVLDTLARAMPGADENSAQEVGLVIAACDRLRDELGCSVVPVHHSGKDIARGARGTSALRGAWDTALEIEGSGKHATMTVADQKEAEAGQRLSFTFEEVQVGIGRTSLVPVLEDPNSEKTQRYQAGHFRMSPMLRIVMECVEFVVGGKQGSILPEMEGLPRMRGAYVDDVRKVFYDRMATHTYEAKKKAFTRHFSSLVEQKIIGAKAPYVWIVNPAPEA